MSALQIFGSQSIAAHQAQQQDDGAWNIALASGPTAHRARVNVEEAGQPHLRQAKAVHGCAEIVGRHVRSAAQRGFGGYVETHGGDQGIEVVGGLSLKAHDLDAFTGAAVGPSFSGLDGVEVEAVFGPVLIEEHHGNLARQLGHFILQWAWAPFRMTLYNRTKCPVSSIARAA